MTNTIAAGPIDPRKALALYLFKLPVGARVIPTVRVSSAQARGAAKRHSYWGAVRYEIRLTLRDGYPANIATERATSDRRSERLAGQDAAKIAESEGRIYMGQIGQLSREACARVLTELGVTGVDTIAA